MTWPAASLPLKTATPFAAAAQASQAARRRLAADEGFHALVEDDASDTGDASGTGAAAKPRTTSATSADTVSKDAASSSLSAVPATPLVLAVPPVASSQTSDRAAGPGTQSLTAPAVEGSAQAAAAGPSPGDAKARLGWSLPAQPTPDDLAESDEEAGGTGAPLPDGVQAGSQAAAPAATSSSGPATPPALAAGSPAQPLIAALSGSGVTMVKAQAGPTGAGLRSGAAFPARTKGASPGSELADQGDATLSAAAPADPTQAPILLALTDNPSQDDASDDNPSGGSTSADDGTVAAAQSSFSPVASVQAQTVSPAAGAATPMSATAADLAAQIAAKVTAGSSRFQLQLNPLGLGRVDVSVSIGRDRQLSATLSFADSQTASALSAHAGELKTALEQAGFNVPIGGFDFTSSAAGSLGANLQGGFDSGGASGGSGDGSAPSGNGRMTAFSAGEALASAGASDSTAWTSGGDSRLDIRI